MLIDNFLKNKVIFITGATGTVGGSILRYIVENFYDDFKAIKVLSRDEYKLFRLVEEFKSLDKDNASSIEPHTTSRCAGDRARFHNCATTTALSEPTTFFRLRGLWRVCAIAAWSCSYTAELIAELSMERRSAEKE